MYSNIPQTMYAIQRYSLQATSPVNQLQPSKTKRQPKTEAITHVPVKQLCRIWVDMSHFCNQQKAHIITTTQLSITEPCPYFAGTSSPCATWKFQSPVCLMKQFTTSLTTGIPFNSALFTICYTISHPSVSRMYRVIQYIPGAPFISID